MGRSLGSARGCALVVDRIVIVVGLTSSTAAVGVAIAVDGRVVAHHHGLTDRRHAEELTPMISSALTEAGIEMAEVDRFAADIGPGRFTGLRVGLASARALALAMDLPLVGISSLELLAAGHERRPVTAVIDARRNEVFQQSFFADGSASAPIVGPPDELARAVEGAAVGDGADRYDELYGASLERDRQPSAAVLVQLAAERPALPGREVEPLYLRNPDVQVNIRTRHT